MIFSTKSTRISGAFLLIILLICNFIFIVLTIVQKHVNMYI